MIITYRCLRRKQREREARCAAEADQAQPGEPEEQAGAPATVPATATPVADSTLEVTSAAKSPWWRLSSDSKFNLLLMAALAIGVFLETLDYTGA